MKPTALIHQMQNRNKHVGRVLATLSYSWGGEVFALKAIEGAADGEVCFKGISATDSGAVRAHRWFVGGSLMAMLDDDALASPIGKYEITLSSGFSSAAATVISYADTYIVFGSFGGGQADISLTITNFEHGLGWPVVVLGGLILIGIIYLNERGEGTTVQAKVKKIESDGKTTTWTGEVTVGGRPAPVTSGVAPVTSGAP